jgi:hypothetical protein
MAKDKDVEKPAEKPSKERLVEAIGQVAFLIALAEKQVSAGVFLNPDSQRNFYEACAELADLVEEPRLKANLVVVPTETSNPPASDPESLKPMIVTLKAVKSSLERSLKDTVDKETEAAKKADEAKEKLQQRIQAAIALAGTLIKEGRDRKTAKGDPLDTDVWYVDCLRLGNMLEGVAQVFEALRKTLSDPPRETEAKPLSKMLAVLQGVLSCLTEDENPKKA